jgi:TolA-binding protein
VRAGADRCPEALFARGRRGPLSLVERRALDAHLGVCGLCRGSMLLAALGDGVPDESDQVIEARVVRLATEVAHGKAHARTRRRRLWRPLAVALAAAVLAMAGAAAAWVVARRAETARRGERSGISFRSGGGSRAIGPASPTPTADEAPTSAERAAPLPQPARTRLGSAAPLDLAAGSEGDHRGTDGPTSRHPGVGGIPRPLAGTSPSGVRVGQARLPSGRDLPRVQGPGELFAAANSARRAGSFRDAVARYRALQRRFPASDEAQLSFFSAGDVLLRLGEPGRALVEFDRYLDVRPTGDLAVEALFGRARCLDALGRPDEGGEAWRRLLREFPRSIYGSTARRRLAELER